MAQILICMPLIRALIHHLVMLEGPQSIGIQHKLVLMKNVHQNAFYTITLGKKGPKVAQIVNLAPDWTFWLQI